MNKWAKDDLNDMEKEMEKKDSLEIEIASILNMNSDEIEEVFTSKGLNSEVELYKLEESWRKSKDKYSGYFILNKIFRFICGLTFHHNRVYCSDGEIHCQNCGKQLRGQRIGTTDKYIEIK